MSTTVMNQLANKTSDPNDNDFILQDIVKSVTGSSNVGDIRSQLPGYKEGAGLSMCWATFLNNG